MVKSGAPEKDILEQAGINLDEASGMRKLVIDLSEERSGAGVGEFTYPGDIIIKEKLSGSASIAFAQPSNWFPIGRFSKFERSAGFERFFIKNDPQPGKELVLHVGGQSETDISGATTTSQLVNTEDAPVNPAERSGWEDFEYSQNRSESTDTVVSLNDGGSLLIPHEAALSVKALSSNSGDIFIGKSGVTETSGYPLSPGHELSLRIRDVSIVKFYVPADGESGDGVAWVVEQEE